MSAFLIALFGATYAWMALQPTFNRPLLMVTASGKCGVFISAVALALSGSISTRLVVLASGDMAFGMLWFAWLLQVPRHAD